MQTPTLDQGERLTTSLKRKLWRSTAMERRAITSKREHSLTAYTIGTSDGMAKDSFHDTGFTMTNTLTIHALTG